MKWTKDVTKTRLVSASESGFFAQEGVGETEDVNPRLNGKEGQKKETPRKASHLPRKNIEPGARLPQLGQQQERMQNRTDDIRRQARLILLHQREPTRQDPRVLHHNVQPLESHGALGKEADGLVVREVELPDFEDARAAGGPLDGPPGRLALFDVPDGEDDFGGVEADEVAGGFEAEAGVAAGDDDGLAGVLFGGVWGHGEELGAEEGEGFLHVMDFFFFEFGR